jgi:hypothetical protein
MDRRAFLQSVAAAAAVTAIPPVPSIASIPPAASAPKNVAWAVGTWGERDWTDIFAPDEATAKKFWAEENFGDCECGKPGDDEPDYVCDGCSADLGVSRVPEWDGAPPNKNVDWLNVGIGTICDRCGDEVDPNCDGHAVGDQAVCSYCMERADWEIVDPEHAAYLREDAA